MKNKTRAFLVVISALFLAGTPVWAKGPHSFSYSDQTSWNFESGHSQSPIAINSSDAIPMTDGGELKFDNNVDVINTNDNSHSIQVDCGGKTQIDGRNFNLVQFHFHSPSEHTLDGKSYPMEVHFVNKAQNGRLAVIGVFFTEGAENSAFQTVMQNLAKDGSVSGGKAGIDIEKLLPANKSYYHYLGSLTTPPLSENVEWYVMKEPIEVSAQQIEAFNRYYDGNNRAVQPLNGRPLLVRSE